MGEKLTLECPFFREKPKFLMCEFTNLESLYFHLENHAIEYKYEHEIFRLFIKLREVVSDPEELQRIQWEIDFFNYRIKDGKIINYSVPNEKGQNIGYPAFDRFDIQTYNYLEQRLKDSSNPLLKMRYSLILWHSPRKHIQYAQIAIQSLLTLAKTYEQKDKQKPNEHFGLFVLDSIMSAYYVALQAKKPFKKVHKIILKTIKNYRFTSSSSFVIRLRLINLMLNDGRRFKKDDLTGFQTICHRIYKRLISKKNYNSAINMLEIGEKLDKKLGEKTFEWRRLIAQTWESLMKQAFENNNPAFIDFCQNALECYQILKDVNKINELEKKYSELRSKIKLKEIKTKVDVTEQLKKINKMVKQIVRERNSEEIVTLLMTDKSLLPRYDDLDRMVQDRKGSFIADELFGTGIIDHLGNSAQHFSSEEEKHYFKIMQQFGIALRLHSFYLVKEIFIQSIIEGKLTCNILLNYLHKYSWFGKTLVRKLPNGQEVEYNWLSLIAPSLYEYFSQMEYAISSQNYPNLVLCIDSLTLKIEGLVRNICEFSGITTFFITKDKKGRKLTREKDIHALLYEKPIQDLFDKDDLLLFKYLLVEKAGFNLRHKVAHSLMLFQEYTINLMHLLIIVLLRFGKYDFTESEV